MGIRSLVLVAVSALVACTGDTGPMGPGGPTGPQGPMGPEGPLAAPPVLSSLSPSWGSGNTQVTILGQNFSTTAADNHVYFDGYPATVVSATATELVVTAGVASDEGETPMVVSVEVANQVSNGLFFALVPSGTAGALDLPMPTAPTSVVEVGNELYIAAGISGAGSRSAGLYRMDPTGSVTRVFAADTVEVSDGQGGTFTLSDGPVALASDGTDVYFTTSLGAVRRYDPASGDVNEILAPALGGGAFPGRTGMAFDSAGTLYVVDRNFDQQNGSYGAIWIIENDAPTGIIVHGGFDGSGSSAAGIYGIASDGTDLWVTNEYWGEVYRITDPLASYAVALVADGAWELRGIALVDEDGLGGPETVVVSENPSDPEGAPHLLLSAAKTDTGGTLQTWGDITGYLYTASGLAIGSGGDLLLAQPDGGVVRRMPAGQTDSTIVAAGIRPAFAAARAGTTTYLATFGPALFGWGPSLTQPDAAVVEVQASGASRVLATGTLFAGLVVSGTDELTTGDCFGARLFTIDVVTGNQVTRLDASDGITCPAGMARSAAGDLYFADIDFGGSSVTYIDRLTAADVHTPQHVTALDEGALFLALAGDTLLSSGFGGQAFDIRSASASAGGAASSLVPAATAGQVGLAAGPDGRAFALRFGLGTILEIDTSTGELLPYGTALARGSVVGPGGGSFAFTATFMADGTMVVPDFGQGGLIAVTP